MGNLTGFVVGDLELCLGAKIAEMNCEGFCFGLLPSSSSFKAQYGKEAPLCSFPLNEG